MPTQNQKVETTMVVSQDETAKLIEKSQKNTAYLVAKYNEIAVWDKNADPTATALAHQVRKGLFTLREANAARAVAGLEPIQAINIGALQPGDFGRCGQFIVAVEPLDYMGEEAWTDETYFVTNHSTRSGSNLFRKVSDPEASPVRLSSLPASDYRPATAAEIEAAVQAIVGTPYGLFFRDLMLNGADPDMSID